MHPLFRNRKYLFNYCLAWAPVGAMLVFAVSLPARLTAGEGVLIGVPVAILLAIICLSAWFVARSQPRWSTPGWKKALNHVMAAIFASALVLVFAHYWVNLWNRFFPNLEERFAPSVPVLAGISWLIYLLALMISQLSIAMESSQRAEMLSREAELRALKAQINPHFLFNSLNSISALTSTDPVKAREMCIRLSEFLRSSLRL
jgi:sensor histidine kinase YesM